MSAPRVFDLKHYESLNSSRWAVVSALLSGLKEPLGLRTAVDVGCGLGYFSGLLQSAGLQVSAVDGRAENVEEARRRLPQITFQQCDAEDAALQKLGTFDLVFCFGLLYHLENPLLAIRHLCAMTGRLLLVEGVIFPGDEPIMGLVDEGPTEDQGLNHFAFYPTEACLQKMLYRAGFRFVYRFALMPEHPEYHSGLHTRKIRTMVAASPAPIDSKLLIAVSEPSTSVQLWDHSNSSVKSSTFSKLKRFADKPLPQKVASVKRLVNRRSR